MDIRSLTIVLSVSLLGACVPLVPAPAPAPVVVAAATPANESVAGNTTEQHQKFLLAAARLGYRFETVHSKPRYCTRVDHTESYIPQKICLTEAQMAAKIEAGPERVQLEVMPATATPHINMQFPVTH
jgi:hypothetical protein